MCSHGSAPGPALIAAPPAGLMIDAGRQRACAKTPEPSPTLHPAAPAASALGRGSLAQFVHRSSVPAASHTLSSSHDHILRPRIAFAAMGAPQAGSPPNAGVSAPGSGPAYDSDWEYEYDETQTEDFYFTLDLPDSGETRSKRRKTNPTPKAALDEVLASNLNPRGRQYVANDHVRQQSQDRPDAGESIHFSDIHTSTPIVEAGGLRYTCRWTTDLGTQFHVSRPGIATRPFRAGHAVDVVALSRVRLTGRHARPPSPGPAEGATGVSAGHAIVLDDDEEDAGGTGESTKTVGSTPRASFLERLAQIQRTKQKRVESIVTNGNSPDQPTQISSTARPSPQDQDSETSHDLVPSAGSTANHNVRNQNAESAHAVERTFQHDQPEHSDEGSLAGVHAPEASTQPCHVECDPSGIGSAERSEAGPD